MASSLNPGNGSMYTYTGDGTGRDGYTKNVFRHRSGTKKSFGVMQSYEINSDPWKPHKRTQTKNYAAFKPVDLSMPVFTPRRLYVCDGSGRDVYVLENEQAGARPPGMNSKAVRLLDQAGTWNMGKAPRKFVMPSSPLTRRTARRQKAATARLSAPTERMMNELPTRPVAERRWAPSGTFAQTSNYRSALSMSGAQTARQASSPRTARMRAQVAQPMAQAQ